MAKKTKKEKDLNQIRAKHVDARPFSEINSLKVYRRSKKRKRINRSIGGDIALIIFLMLCGILSFAPLLLTICNAFKPLDELYLFPPRFFVKNPTLDNFRDLSTALGTSLVPFSRYLFNSIMVTIVGTIGHIFIASMCAYPLAKRNVPGGKVIFRIVVLSLMFPATVTAIPHYIIFNWLGLINTYWAIILPSFTASLGLFLMKQFMTQVPTELIEAAKVDGASEFRIYFKIVMPLVKPAWMTLGILLFQSLWITGGEQYIYREDFKMISYALKQIGTAGAARTGTLAAVSLIMISVPIIVFVFLQSQVMETMAQSGIK